MKPISYVGHSFFHETSMLCILKSYAFHEVTIYAFRRPDMAGEAKRGQSISRKSAAISATFLGMDCVKRGRDRQAWAYLFRWVGVLKIERC